MKLYFFAGSWELPGQQTKGASRVDLPKTPAEMVHWLNHRRVPIAMPLNPPPELAIQPDEGREIEQPAPAPEPQQRYLNPTDIEDWILNVATVTQVENMFSRMGTRFAELLKDSKQ